MAPITSLAATWAIARSRRWSAKSNLATFGRFLPSTDVLRIPAAMPPYAVMLSKTIDAFSGHLYPQPRYILPPPLRRTLQTTKLAKQLKSLFREV
jgi:hypothetical protein